MRCPSTPKSRIFAAAGRLWQLDQNPAGTCPTVLNGDLYATSEVGGDVEILALVEVAVVGIAKDAALVLGLHEVEEILVLGGL